MDKDISIAVISVIGSVITTLIGKGYLEKRNKNKLTVVETPKLQYHPFSMRMTEMITFLKTGYYIQNKGRMILSRDHLILKMESGKKILMDLALLGDECHSNCSLDKMGCGKLYDRNMKALDQIIIEYNMFIHSQTFTPEEKEVIEVYTRKFNEWHSNRIDRMRSIIECTCSSDYYRGAGCKVRQSIILDHYVTLYSDTIRDAQDTMTRINGELTGRIYKGHIL